MQGCLVRGVTYCALWYLSIFCGFLVLLCPLLPLLFFNHRLYRRCVDVIFAIWEMYPVVSIIHYKQFLSRYNRKTVDIADGITGAQPYTKPLHPRGLILLLSTHDVIHEPHCLQYILVSRGSYLIILLDIHTRILYNFLFLLVVGDWDTTINTSLQFILKRSVKNCPDKEAHRLHRLE